MWPLAFKGQPVKSISPSKGGLKEGDVSVDLGAVPEGFDVGGVDGHGLGECTHTDSVAGWRKGKTLSGYLFSIQVSLSLSLSSSF